MIRRIIIRVIVFLLVGAIINVAVAWACNLSRSRQSTRAVTADSELRWWKRNAPPGFESIEEMKQFDRFGGFGREVAQWPRTHVAVVSAFVVQRRRTGWPLLSMERSYWHDYPQACEVTKHAWNLPYLEDKRERDVVPMLPLWPGFAINTIFYAAVLWLLFAAPGFIRRRIRRFRGRCIHCGYDLRGQPSPEAGESIKCPECGRSAL